MAGSYQNWAPPPGSFSGFSSPRGVEPFINWVPGSGSFNGFNPGGSGPPPYVSPYLLEILSTRSGAPAWLSATSNLLANTGQRVTNTGLLSGGYCLGDDGLLHYLGPNLWPNSQVKAGVTDYLAAVSTDNAGIAPDGTNTAVKFAYGGSFTDDSCVYNNTAGALASCTISAYVKAGTYSHAALGVDNVDGGGATFLLSGAGSVTDLTNATNPTITALPNSWYRISVTLGPSAHSELVLTFGDADAMGVYQDPFVGHTFVAGDAGFWWGIMAQPGETVTPYIRTDSTALGPVRVQPAAANLLLGTQPGLLRERGSTNQCLQSVQVGFGGAGNPWFNVAQGPSAPVVTLSSTDVLDPTGGSSASKIVLGATTAGNQYSVLYQQLQLGCKNTSLYLRCAAGQSATLYLFSFDSAIVVTCNVTDQWQRFVLAGMSGAGEGGYIAFGSDTRAVTNQTPQMAACTIYAWCTQGEVQYEPSSPIATEAVVATRDSDQPTCDNPLFGLSAPAIQYGGLWAPQMTWDQLLLGFGVIGTMCIGPNTFTGTQSFRILTQPGVMQNSIDVGPGAVYCDINTCTGDDANQCSGNVVSATGVLSGAPSPGVPTGTAVTADASNAVGVSLGFPYGFTDTYSFAGGMTDLFVSTNP